MLLLKDVRFQYLAVLAVVLLFYSRTLQYGFIWDDFNYIVNNPALGQGTRFFDLWTHKMNVDFWPVTYSVLWVLKYFFGANPLPYHAFNVGLYALSCLLILHLLHQLKVKYAFLIALIFAIHPMNVSLVAWAFQMKTNLANVFGLISAINFLRFHQQRKLSSYLLSLFFLTVSFLSKISLVLMPVIYLLYLFQTEVRIFAKKNLVILPFFALSLIAGLANLFWEKGLGFVPVPPSEIILPNSLLMRILVMGQNYLFYFYESFCPLRLMFVHPKIEPDPGSPLSYLPVTLLILALITSALLILSRKFKKFPSFVSGFLLSFLLLFPVLGLFEIYFMRFSYVAEHYLTLALLGFLVPVTLRLAAIKWGQVVIGCFMLYFTYQTWTYTPAYQDEKTVFEDTLQKNPGDLLSHNVLGLIYKNESDYPKALNHYDKAIKTHPNAAAYYNKAIVFEKMNQLDLARENFQKSIELNPYIGDTYMNLGLIYLKQNDFKSAFGYLNQALQHSPQNPIIYYNMGYAYETTHDKKQAYTWYKKALELAPTNKIFQDAVNNLNP